MSEFSKTLIFFGVVLILIGLAAAVLGKIPGVGRLPGDIYFKKGSFTFYFPLATSLILSLILTLFFMLFGKK
jgi:hypothetical protein